jgi:hypothetical protein
VCTMNMGRSYACHVIQPLTLEITLRRN